jgi:ABC-type sulfate transport system substrate-binding protein
VNQVLPTLFDPASERALVALGAAPVARDDDQARALVAVADARRQRERIEVQQRARMLELGLPVIEIAKRGGTTTFGPKEIDDVAALFERAAQGKRP